MKKLFVSLSLFVSMFGLTGCQSSEKQEQPKIIIINTAGGATANSGASSPQRRKGSWRNYTAVPVAAADPAGAALSPKTDVEIVGN